MGANESVTNSANNICALVFLLIFTKPGPGVLETDILNMNLQKVGSGLYVLKKTH